MSELKPAEDGYPARVVEHWSHEKLYYLERYLDIFCTAMKDKWTLVYGDFLAGPGVCIDQETGEEVPGSPLRAVAHPEFQRLFLNDGAPQVSAALRARTAAEPASRVRVAALDCNQAVDQARAFLFPPREPNRTLGLAVIDPTAFQMRFESVRRLTKDIRLDLIVIFMSGFIRRFISTPEYERTLDDFFGTPDWRALITKKNAGERLTYRHLLDLYERQLATLGYIHIDDSQNMKNTRNSTIYHIIFASQHPLGTDFFNKIGRQAYNGQRRFELA